MPLPEAYTTIPGNIPKLLDAIQAAGVPPRVTVEFLKTLGFKSSNDRNLIRILKAIEFLDDNGVPTARYREFRDRSKGAGVLADALRFAYEDLFLAHTKAQELSTDKLKGIIATKTSKGDRVVSEIARTFQALAKKADFSASPSSTAPGPEEKPETPTTPGAGRPPDEPTARAPRPAGHSFHYNIQIHLPTTTDITVYNAIFRSLKENLL